MNETSEKQIDANKQNAVLGGVKTDEGKAISRYNATKHGLLRESITPFETLDYKALYNSLAEVLEPKNMLEEILLERIAVSYVKLMRLAKAEAEVVKESLDPTVEGVGGLVLIDHQGYEPQLSSKSVEKLLSVYSRYETAAENRMYKAMNKLFEIRAKMT